MKEWFERALNVGQVGVMLKGVGRMQGVCEEARISSMIPVRRVREMDEGHIKEDERPAQVTNTILLSLVAISKGHVIHKYSPGCRYRSNSTLFLT